MASNNFKKVTEIKCACSHRIHCLHTICDHLTPRDMELIGWKRIEGTGPVTQGVWKCWRCLENPMPAYFQYYIRPIEPRLRLIEPNPATEEHILKAMKIFGTTADPYDAFYLLPNGKYLKVGGTPEHSFIVAAQVEEMPLAAEIDFKRAGLIRMRMRGKIFEIHKRPTSAQRAELAKCFRELSGEVHIDIESAWAGSFRLGTFPGGILSKIDAVFDGKSPGAPLMERRAYLVTVIDPRGRLSAGAGSVCCDIHTQKVYVNKDGGTSWTETTLPKLCPA